MVFRLLTHMVQCCKFIGFQNIKYIPGCKVIRFQIIVYHMVSRLLYWIISELSYNIWFSGCNKIKFPHCENFGSMVEKARCFPFYDITVKHSYSKLMMNWRSPWLITYCQLDIIMHYAYNEAKLPLSGTL